MISKSDEVKLKAWLKSHLRQFFAVFLIWCLGWLGFSCSWIIISFVIWTAWNHLKVQKKEKLKILQAITTDEKGLLLKVKDLPSWVSVVLISNH